MDKVLILMSTYNGEKYVRQQIDSILKQSQNVDLLIRDDGSTDGTIEILKDISEYNKNITFYCGENIGVIRSFFQLLDTCSDEYDYYGLADQDDVWLENKVEKAIGKIAQYNKDIPLLYCSNVLTTDEKLNVIKTKDVCPRPSVGNALVQNICVGCTCVMNRKLKEIIKVPDSRRIVMHDWWLYLTATLFGKVIYDEEAFIMYRQHGKNVYGRKTNKLQLLIYRLKQLIKKRGYIYIQLEEILEQYDSISVNDFDLIGKVLKSKKRFVYRVKLVCDKRIYKNSREDDIVYRLSVLIGKL